MGLSKCWDCERNLTYDCDRCVNDDLFLEKKEKSIILTDKTKDLNKYNQDKVKLNGKYDLIVMVDRDGADIILMKFGIPILNHIKGNPEECLKKIGSFIVKNDLENLEYVYIDYSGYGKHLYHNLEKVFEIYGISNKLNILSHSIKLF